ncbi:DUF3644 domain-containing protein [Mesoflavibacter sp. SCSIO 43206]|uniref:DUF3644 domain-containing protein n=1 Tax=Mesoflavibacter sp. SCSIO 43206 TaxID=2779362 RepID=UPI001CA7D87C|nr:DUF3644 domain-containing protein [Mesoflavibacter sp. SCSIO 43206]UAB75215.1 DUF3644 domain-containing protein [Mesoflavibacter sp. SCSIO 43206]
MTLRKGKTKSTLESSIESALLAVEIYNKPRTPFRVEGFITQMIMAWTRLFHAHFHNTIGNKYYYKNSNGRYQLIDGEKKSWELKTCITKHGKLPASVKSNLIFFIKLRNKIEHRHIDRDEIGVIIFGECQALLFNYENILINFFGEEYALNESLAFSLQFSRLRNKSQLLASKKLLSKEIKELKYFIETYRNSLSEDIFNTQEYSIKLVQVPKISNTNRNDLAIEFVNWNSVSESDKKSYDKVTAIIKDKVVKKEAINPGKRKPSDVISKVNSEIDFTINHYDHKCLYSCFKIRPSSSNDIDDPFDTNINYCHYDEVHNDYVYQDAWAELIIKGIKEKKLSKKIWKQKFKEKDVFDITNFQT